MRRLGLFGACLALFVGVALTAIPPAGAAAPAPTIKCDAGGDTVVHWDSAFLRERGFGKVTEVTIRWTVLFGLHTAEGAAINGNNARTGTALFATKAVAQLTFADGRSFPTPEVGC